MITVLDRLVEESGQCLLLESFPMELAVVTLRTWGKNVFALGTSRAIKQILGSRTCI